MRLAITPIVERLRAGGFARVEGVLEFGRQDAPPRTLPALYVVPVGERAGGNGLDIGSDQAVDVDFAVMLVVDGARRNAAGIAEDIHAEGERIKAALAGWTHPDASRACEFRRAALGSARGPVIVWDLRFTARYRLRRKR